MTVEMEIIFIIVFVLVDDWPSAVHYRHFRESMTKPGIGMDS